MSFDLLGDMFQEIDEDGDGFITAPELKAAMAKAGVPFRNEQLEFFMKLADDDGDGKIEYDELMRMELFLATDKADNEEELRSMFDMLDKNSDGFIDASVVKIALASQNGDLTSEDVAKRMEKFKVEGNQIDVKVFVNVMKG